MMAVATESKEESTDVSAAKRPEGPVVFFDGECGMCNRFVDFLMARDTRGVLKYAPLQGKTAETLLAEEFRGLDTVVYRDEERILPRSTAVAATLADLSGVWTVASWALWLIPKPIRDLGYRIVAANRFRLFGKRQGCRLPTPEEADRLLP